MELRLKFCLTCVKLVGTKTIYVTYNFLSCIWCTRRIKLPKAERLTVIATETKSDGSRVLVLQFGLDLTKGKEFYVSEQNFILLQNIRTT